MCNPYFALAVVITMVTTFVVTVFIGSFDRFDVYYFQRLFIPTSIAIFVFVLVFVLLISRLMLAGVVMAALVVAVVVILIVFMVAAMTRQTTSLDGPLRRLPEDQRIMTSSGGT